MFRWLNIGLVLITAGLDGGPEAAPLKGLYRVRDTYIVSEMVLISTDDSAGVSSLVCP